MEHGSLYDILHNETMPITEDIMIPILRDIAQGMRFLHAASPQVLHGDLKAANILVDGKFRGKVADFGLSQKRTLGGTGTPFWMAPELLRRESTNTAATDVYSFGIILYEVYSRKDPYDGEDAMEVLRLVADQGICKRPPVPENCTAQVHSLIADCIVDDREKRPTFEEIDTRLKRIDTALIETNAAQKNTAISLFDIFPKHIAEALRDGKTVEAEHRDIATIFFSDIVGFTSISSELPPMKVASMLDRLYTKLDALSQKHDVFKVETIGDAYMAVTNLVKDQPDDHCKRIAEFAIDALAAANDTIIDLDNLDKGCVNIRVGFHSGSIVADVVGTRNPRYCLFGDAVNTASRMESASKANRIHCSNKAADILMSQCPDIPLKSRGVIPIKGKGDMQTYWVNFDSSKNRGGKKRLPGGMQTLREAENSGEFLPEVSDAIKKKPSIVDSSDKSVETAPIVSDGTAETLRDSLSDNGATPLDLEAKKARLMREDDHPPPESAPTKKLEPLVTDVEAPRLMSSSVAEKSIRSVLSAADLMSLANA
jgi:guanylate cyclase